VSSPGATGPADVEAEIQTLLDARERTQVALLEFNRLRAEEDLKILRSFASELAGLGSDFDRTFVERAVERGKAWRVMVEQFAERAAAFQLFGKKIGERIQALKESNPREMVVVLKRNLEAQEQRRGARQEETFALEDRIRRLGAELSQLEPTQRKRRYEWEAAPEEPGPQGPSGEQPV